MWLGPLLEDYDYLVKLYSFGEKINDEIFQDHVMNALRHRLYNLDPGGPPPSFLPDKERLLDVFRSTPHNSKLRHMAVDLYISFSGSGCHTGATTKAHREFQMHYLERLTYLSKNPHKCGFMKQALQKGWPWPYFHSIDGLKGVEG